MPLKTGFDTLHTPPWLHGTSEACEPSGVCPTILQTYRFDAPVKIGETVVVVDRADDIEVLHYFFFLLKITP